MKSIIIAMTLLTSIAASAESNFFQAGQNFVDSNRKASGYIDKVGADGKLHVTYPQGKGSYNTYEDIIDQEGIARASGCNKNKSICVGDVLIIKTSDSKAIALEASGILQDGNVTVERSLIEKERIANPSSSACKDIKGKKICIGSNVAIYGDKKLRTVSGFFPNDKIAVYNETIYSNSVRTDYFKVVDMSEVENK